MGLGAAESNKQKVLSSSRRQRAMNEAKVMQRYILDLPPDFGKIQFFFFFEVVTEMLVLMRV